MTFKFLSLAMAAVLVLLAPAANASLYNFTQTGYEQGASISGSFEATDLNANGQLVGSIFTNFAEITAFTVSFSGNSLVSAFTHTLSDLSYLGFIPAISTIGSTSTEGIATNWFGTSGFYYVSGVGPTGEVGGYVQNNDTGLWSHTENLINVSAVPVPGAVWLFASALVGFIGTARRKMHLA